MSDIGSVGLDSTCCGILCMGQRVVTGYWCPPRVISYYIDRPVLHHEASLQKMCALEMNQAGNKLIISEYLKYECTTAVPYCCM